ncbi:hypothetical protein [Pseudomonas phage vB_Pa-PAC2]
MLYNCSSYNKSCVCLRCVYNSNVIIHRLVIIKV